MAGECNAKRMLEISYQVNQELLSSSHWGGGLCRVQFILTVYEPSWTMEEAMVGWPTKITAVPDTQQRPFWVRTKTQTFLTVWMQATESHSKLFLQEVADCQGEFSDVKSTEQQTASHEAAWPSLTLGTALLPFPQIPENIFLGASWFLPLHATHGSELPWDFLRIQSKFSASSHSELNKEATQAKKLC